MNEVSESNGSSKNYVPIIGDLVLSFIKIVESNNSTEVALAKIDSDMRIAVSRIQTKANVAGCLVQVCSNQMQAVLNNSSLTFEQKTAFIDKFTTVMLDSLDKL